MSSEASRKKFQTEHRQQPRLQAEIRVKLRILIPEETLTPRAYEGRMSNISPKGILVFLKKFPVELYAKMMRTPRYARVTFDPGDGTNISVTGQIVWVDFERADAQQQSGACSLGMCFEEHEMMPAFRKFLETLQSRTQQS